MTIQQHLKERNLPDVLSFADGTRVKDAVDWQRRREEIIKLLCEQEYGFLPPPPIKVEATMVEQDERFCAGKAVLTKVMLQAHTEEGVFSFPLYCTVPNGGPHPAVVCINFRPDVPDKYLPSEELCDSGFAVFSFCYQDVTTDDADRSNGLAAMPCVPRETGKIALWAWAAMRVMDYIETLPNIEKSRVVVAGHSRLGKTALLAGALDERFAAVMSNNSGCSGAAITRGKQGEQLSNICGNYPFWFCERYPNYVGNESAMPFDQHFLLSLIAPRLLYVASAQEDIWADPVSEFLSCAAASPVYELLGHRGLNACALPRVGECFQNGRIGYHLRSGKHYFSRYDWNMLIEFLSNKL